MAMIHGKGGSVTWAGANVLVGTEITSWSMDATCDTADATNMASANDWREFLAGFKSWTATVETNWDSGDTTVDDILGASGALVLELVAGGADLAGTAICTGLTFNTDMGDVIKISYSFQGSGAVAYNA